MTVRCPKAAIFIGRAQTTTSVAAARPRFLVEQRPEAGGRDHQDRRSRSILTSPAPTARASRTFLTGKGPLGAVEQAPGDSTFIEGTGLAMNTIPPNDFSYYEMLDALVQEQPAEALDAGDRRASSPRSASSKARNSILTRACARSSPTPSPSPMPPRGP